MSAPREVPEGRMVVRGHGAWRTEYREDKGPRGGRVTYSRVTCAQCGLTAEIKDPHPGNRDWESAATKAQNDGGQACHRALDAGLLWELVSVLRADHTPVLPMEWSVLWLPNGLEQTIEAAWQHCQDGAAMARLLIVLQRRVETSKYEVNTIWDGRFAESWAAGHPHTMDAWLCLDGARLMIAGDHATVARQLRRLVPWITQHPAWAAGTGPLSPQGLENQQRAGLVNHPAT